MSEFIKSNPLFCSWVSDDIITNDRIDAYYYDNKFIEFEKEVIELGCEVLELEDIFDKITDGDHDQREYVNSGISFYSVKNIEEFYINSENIEYIKQQDHQRLKRSQLEYQDMLITKTGRIGTVAIVPYNFGEGNISADVAILKGNRVNIDKHYLATYLNSKYGELAITRLNYGSTRPRLTLKDIPKVRVPNVEHSIQKYIGDKVRKAEELREEAKGLEKVCEDKIKKILKISENESLYNNNAGNKTTEYNKYPINLFIAVRDVKERLDANAYHPEYYETVERIKNSLIEYSKLDDMVESYGTGKSSPLYVSDGVPILMTKNIKNNCIDWNCKMVNSQELNRKDIVNMNEVLITTYGGPSIGKVDILYEDILTTFDYTILKMKFKEQFNAYFMTLLLRSKLIQNQIRYMIKGTTGITFVNSKEILSVLVPKVDKVEQDEIGNIYKNVLMKMKLSKQLIQEAKKDVEDFIEGNFDMSKLNQS